ncbi:MAG: hypothetical protein RSF41_09745 [Lachnospiraceae bacterium]
MVSFNIGEKTFIYPEAFLNFLSVDNAEAHTYIHNLLEQKAFEKELLIEQKRVEQQKLTATGKAQAASKNKYKRANIAFKCNYCDGGKSAVQIGFEGVCSDEMIYNNIKIQNRTWCNSDDCACLHYLNHEISRKELDKSCTNGGFVCYESQMLRDWKALAGIVQNGEHKDEPMKLHQVQRNSLCVLTTRTPEMAEKERFIFAIFLVDDTYEGDGKEEGYVSTQSKYKIKLSPKEATNLLFWNYHANGSKADVPAWNSGLHRYFEDDVAVQILRDISKIKEGSTEQQLATEFLDEFCRTNGIDKNDVGEPNGALKL